MKSRTPKTLFIKCRVTPGDRERLHELMRKTGHRSEASFIRDAVFKDKPITIPTSSPTDDEILQKMNELIREFNRIGINYNQIAVKVNTASLPLAQALNKKQGICSGPGNKMCRLDHSKRRVRKFSQRIDRKTDVSESAGGRKIQKGNVCQKRCNQGKDFAGTEKV